MTKKCKECNQELPIENFKSAGKVKGVQYYKSYCKVCNKIYTSKWKDENIEHWKAGKKKYDQEYYIKNKNNNKK